MSGAHRRGWIGRLVATIVAAGAVTILSPAAVAAPDRIELDVVIDQA